MENGRKLYEKIAEKGFDGAIFTDEINQRWLTGFPSTDGFVLVSKEETLLITDGRYIEAAQSQVASDTRAVLYGTSMAEALSSHCKNYGWKKVCVDGTRVTVSQLERLRKMLDGIGVEVENLPGVCAELRTVKTPREIQAIRTAQSITDAAFAHILGVLNVNMTEIEVAAELEYFMRKNGADGTAFETISVSGKKSALPHGVPGNVKLTENAFLTMDFGARYDGYCSDMTRTVVIGKADEEMKLVYETVKKAQEAAIAALRPGVTGREVDKAARDVIENAGYGDYFTHSTGHSLGLEIHEAPGSSFRSETRFVPNQLQTSEPGIYPEGRFGVRIEDLLLVTEDGAEDLTKSPKELIEI